MELDFAIRCPLVQPRMPNLVSVRQVAALLRTSFRRRLAETPLCFASPSPPSGWTGDSHSPAIEHAGHTRGTARGGYKGFWDKSWDFMRTEASVAIDPIV